MLQKCSSILFTATHRTQTQYSLVLLSRCPVPRVLCLALCVIALSLDYIVCALTTAQFTLLYSIYAYIFIHPLSPYILWSSQPLGALRVDRCQPFSYARTHCRIVCRSFSFSKTLVAMTQILVVGAQCPKVVLLVSFYTKTFNLYHLNQQNSSQTVSTIGCALRTLIPNPL